MGVVWVVGGACGAASGGAEWVGVARAGSWHGWGLCWWAGFIEEGWGLHGRGLGWAGQHGRGLGVQGGSVVGGA